MAENANAADFPDTPAGWARRWKMELKAAREAVEKFRKTGDTVDQEFRGEVSKRTDTDTRLEMFYANITTKRAMLYGKTPQVSVSRRFLDAQDDVARVAGEILERLLNCDIERDSDTAEEAYGNALDDRLLPGIGWVRHGYERKEEATEEEEVAAEPDELAQGDSTDDGGATALAPPPEPKLLHEEAFTDYAHWKDVLWSAGARVWGEVDWVGFAADMPREKFYARFPKAPKKVPYAPNTDSKDRDPGPWARIRVWEIWHKPTRRVFWYVEGVGVTIDDDEDPLGLEGFWPCPKPMMANLTTARLVPRSDWALAQDLYTQINTLATRSTELTESIRVAGVYASGEGGEAVQRLLTEAGRGQLIPYKSYAALAEKGGLRGIIDWFPLEPVVNALAVTQERLRVLQDQLFQVTGWSDIMRGEATQAGATATEQRIKGRFGSVRIQAQQDEFAQFISASQRIRAEIICKFYSPETIIERSNAKFFYEDPVLVQEAVALLKSEYGQYRIEVKPEAVSMGDMAADGAERTEVIQTMAAYFTAAAPVAQAMPGSSPYLIEMLQWLVAGRKGASQIEGVLDRATKAAKQQQEQAAANPQQAPPDPKLQAEQVKQQTVMMQGQQKMQAEKAKLQSQLTLGQAEVQNDAMREENQRIQNVQEAAQRALIARATKPAPTNGKPGGVP